MVAPGYVPAIRKDVIMAAPGYVPVIRKDVIMTLPGCVPAKSKPGRNLALPEKNHICS